jgi:hypothetical protein
MQRMMKFSGLNAAAYRERSASPAVNQSIGAKNAAVEALTCTIIHHLAKQGFLLIKQGFLLVKQVFLLVKQGSPLVNLDYLLVKQVILLVRQGCPLVK